MIHTDKIFKNTRPEALAYMYLACKLYSLLPEFSTLTLRALVEGLSNHHRTRKIGERAGMNERELTVYLSCVATY